MKRAEIHYTFAKHFAMPRMKPVAPITDADLSAVEETLKTALPVSYISFATTQGPLFTPNILHELVAAREADRAAPDGFDVQEFFTPTEIVETHGLYVSGGMDDSLIPFAMDGSGNLFGFHKIENCQRPDDLPVLLFDHDYCEVNLQADSFDTWLQAFLQLRL
jgi:hypothetical protein